MPLGPLRPIEPGMTKRFPTGKAAIAGAVGSAAVAAALLYVNHRKKKKDEEEAVVAPPPVTPSGEPPETD